jgi:hypothetical protein
MNQSIYKAMRAHLNTLSNKPPIAYLDQAYSPTGVQYLREGFYSASPDHIAIEYGGTTDHRGYYQIEILTPSNSGAAAGMDKATLLSEHFKRGRHTGFEVMRVDWVPTGTEGAYSVIRMSIYYRVLS